MISLKNKLWDLIQDLSDHFGGDDAKWLEEYFVITIETHNKDLQAVISCLEIVSSRVGVKKRPINVLNDSITCSECNHVPPFCLGRQKGECNNPLLHDKSEGK